MIYPDCVENTFLHSKQKNGFLEDFDEDLDSVVVEDAGDVAGDDSLFSDEEGEKRLCVGMKKLVGG